MNYYSAEYNFEQILQNKHQESSLIAKNLEFFYFYFSGREETLVSDVDYNQEYLDYLKNERKLDFKIVKKANDAQEIKNWWLKDREVNLEKVLNSKISSTKFAQRFGIDKDFPSFILPSQKKALKRYLKSSSHNKWIIKHPFGFSGKGQKQYASDKLEELIEKQCEESIAEPIVKRVFDFGVKISEDDLTFYQQLSNKNRNFVCATFEHTFNENSLLGPHYRKIKEKLRLDFGDHFPYQIDSFVYCEGGDYKLRSICEINHRVTMVDLLWSQMIKTRPSTSALVIIELKKEMKFSELEEMITRLTSSRAYLLSDPQFRKIFVYFYHSSFEGMKSDIIKVFTSVSGAVPKWLVDLKSWQDSPIKTLDC